MVLVHWMGVALVPVVVYMLVCIINREWLINGGALCHELNGASGVCRDVTDGQQPGGGPEENMAVTLVWDTNVALIQIYGSLFL